MTRTHQGDSTQDTSKEELHRRLNRHFRPGVHPDNVLAMIPHPGFGYRTERHGDMLVERDVAIPTRHGTLYADIFRPVDATDVPVIVGYAPFGKHPHIDIEAGFAGAEIPLDELSEFVPWEQFDPVVWTGHGYALAYVDAVGNWFSEGEATFFTPDEAEAGYDIVEWIAQRDWCSGSVGWGGVSYYAMTAWSVAALQPPHLKAIVPWDAASDVYREAYLKGGIPAFPFIHFWMMLTGVGLGRIEDMEAGMREHPTFDEYWACRVANWSQVKVPTYAVSEFSNDLHLRGTIEAWKGIASEQKFLELRGDKEWQGFYEPESQARIKAFFDRFLKGENNQVDSWPRVRIAVRTAGDEWEFREEENWPLPDVRYRTLWLDANTQELCDERPAEISTLSYDSEDPNGSAAFNITFDRRVEMTGNAKLRVWLSALGSNDADVFVGVEKLDADGARVPFVFSQRFNDGPLGFGWLRASHRHLDLQRSREEQPWHTHEAREWLVHGTPVPLDIEIWPNSVVFEPGETLQIIVKGTPIRRYQGPSEIVFAPLHNAGSHVLHTGGDFDSYLYMPVVDRAG
mgnify:CR=1 FL=1